MYQPDAETREDATRIEEEDEEDDDRRYMAQSVMHDRAQLHREIAMLDRALRARLVEHQLVMCMRQLMILDRERDLIQREFDVDRKRSCVLCQK